MNTKLFLRLAIISVALTLGLSACGDDSEADEPSPVDTTATGQPGGGIPGGGIPSGGGNIPGGGDNPPSQSEEDLVGSVNVDGSEYDYTRFSFDADDEQDEQGTYYIGLAYADDEAVADGQFDLFDDGSTAAFSYSAQQAGVVRPGNYAYDESPFRLVFFGIEGAGYVLTEGDIEVNTTSADELLLITVAGYMQEVEFVDNRFSTVSDELFIVQAEFAVFARIDPNARYGTEMSISEKMPFSVQLGE